MTYFDKETGVLIPGDHLPEELEMVQELFPEEIQNWGADHMDTLIQVAYVHDVEPLPVGYVPTAIVIRADEETDVLSYQSGKIEDVDLSFFLKDHSALWVEIDFVLRYAEIRGREVFNAMGGVVLPQEVAKLFLNYKSLLPFTAQ